MMKLKTRHTNRHQKKEYEEEILIADIVSGKVAEPERTPENVHLRFSIYVWKLLEPYHGEKPRFQKATLRRWSSDSKKFIRIGLDLKEVANLIEWAIEYNDCIKYIQSLNVFVRNNFRYYSILEALKELFDRDKVGGRRYIKNK